MGAVFIQGIGACLSNGEAHDYRAPDYDDWTTVDGNAEGLNGDILIWYEPLQKAVEILDNNMLEYKDGQFFLKN